VLSPNTMLRIWEQVRIDPETGCWLWLGSFRNSGRTPVFSFYPEELPGGFPGTRAVRPWLFTFWRGRTPLGALAPRSTCNPKCVNPAHLRDKSRSGS
jgi:hypothetical protein